MPGAWTGAATHAASPRFAAQTARRWRGRRSAGINGRRSHADRRGGPPRPLAGDGADLPADPPGRQIARGRAAPRPHADRESLSPLPAGTGLGSAGWRPGSRPGTTAGWPAAAPAPKALVTRPSAAGRPVAGHLSTGADEPMRGHDQGPRPRAMPGGRLPRRAPAAGRPVRSASLRRGGRAARRASPGRCRRADARGQASSVPAGHAGRPDGRRGLRRVAEACGAGRPAMQGPSAGHGQRPPVMPTRQ